VRSVQVLYDGPVVEAVVTRNTKAHRDASQLNDAPATGPDGYPAAVQQVVRPSRLSEIHSNSVIDVWGERQGDRIVASVIDYTGY
jgi:hypothetical protein